MLLLAAFCLTALVFSATRRSTATRQEPAKAAANAQTAGSAQSEPADVAAFRKLAGGEITPVIIELRGEPGVLRKVAAEREGQRTPP
jgi:hypothetical protein